MKIHVKPNKIYSVICLLVFVAALILIIWTVITASPLVDALYVVAGILVIEGLMFYLLCCTLRSYTFDTNGIYVKWHIGNKTKFYPWSDFIDNYNGRSNIIGEYLETVVFSRNKRRSHANPSLIILEGWYPFSAVGVVLRDDASYSPQKHQHCVRKSELLELLQQSNVSVEWNS